MSSPRRRFPLALCGSLASLFASSVGFAEVDDAERTSDEGEAADAPAAAIEEAGDLEELGELSYRFDAELRLLASAIRNDPDVAFVGRSDGFRIQNARVGASGVWSDWVMLRLSAEGADDERDDPNALRGTLRFALLDAYADLVLARAATLRLGRFAILYDLEEHTSPAERPFARKALPSRGVRATEGFETRSLGVGRDLGVGLRAERAIPLEALDLGYEIALQNGAGELASANDNDRVALSGAAFAHHERGLGFVAVRYNTRSQGELPALRTERDLGVAGGLSLESSRARGGAQVLFERTTFPTTAGPARYAFGASAHVLVSVTRDVELGYRYAVLDPSDRLPATVVQEHTAGANVQPAEIPLRFQLNVTRPVEQAGRSLRNDRLEIVAEVAL